MESEYHIQITEEGRCGQIKYKDGKNSLSFDWEFGGGATVAYIWLREGRTKVNEDGLSDVLKRIGDKIIQEKAKGCVYETDLHSRAISIIEKNT